jgi:hypothetical protein
VLLKYSNSNPHYLSYKMLTENRINALATGVNNKYGKKKIEFMAKI